MDKPDTIPYYMILPIIAHLNFAADAHQKRPCCCWSRLKPWNRHQVWHSKNWNTRAPWLWSSLCHPKSMGWRSSHRVLVEESRRGNGIKTRFFCYKNLWWIMVNLWTCRENGDVSCHPNMKCLMVRNFTFDQSSGVNTLQIIVDCCKYLLLSLFSMYTLNMYSSERE